MKFPASKSDLLALIISKISIIAFLISIIGCAQVTSPIPSEFFSRTMVLDKPVINNLDDINEAYKNLFEAYQNNLILIESLRSLP